MRLRLLGVRGSTPAPGAEFVGYGGHTSCIAVSRSADAFPDLVLDAGTGLRALSPFLGGHAFQGAILLSHLHWDHVQGLPFFAAGDDERSLVDVHLPAQDGLSGRDLLARMMSPPSFPIAPEGLRGHWTFTAMPAGRTRVAGYVVTAQEVAHKGGRTFGYRVETPTASVAYLPDHAPGQGCSEEVRTLVRGVDVLVHDAQFVESERSLADLYGHATVDQAIALAIEAGAGTLVLFHHGPGRTDAELDDLAAGVDASLRVVVAREGAVMDLPYRVAPT